MSARAKTSLVALLDSPLQRPALAAVRVLCRFAGLSKPGRALSYHTSDWLAAHRTTLAGRVPTGSTIRLLARDRVHRYIYLHRLYEAPTTRFFMSTIQRGWTVVDVGANAGYFSLLSADLVGPCGQVIAFEPNPELLDLLNTSVADQQPAVVLVMGCALGTEDGARDLYLSGDPENTGLATLDPQLAAASSERFPVTTTTLDSFCGERSLRPNLVKIDVEGHELAVLQGSRGLLESGVARYVVCELEAARCAASPLLEFMAGFGYQAHSLSGRGKLIDYQARPVQNIVFAAP